MRIASTVLSSSGRMLMPLEIQIYIHFNPIPLALIRMISSSTIMGLQARKHFLFLHHFHFSRDQAEQHIRNEYTNDTLVDLFFIWAHSNI